RRWRSGTRRGAPATPSHLLIMRPSPFCAPPMPDRLAVLSQYLLPKQALTALAGKVASARGGRLTTATIRWFVSHYGVNMQEAAEPDIAAYPTFNEFFTRALKPGARPLARADLVCPV